ncbi:hypothetical protein [Neobacillus kokaensis]|uniref:DUF4822 domain-containing protein n=1 Tax=Neobacillus kokaensis TaxID=2759023 RepID=A0ABQ3N502_9BACI|nr:hypothetical protein [Neobacillus kokaensis]GHH99729.1 hypothetical protein AM1BK_32720 [Neobacillus kokaensis]
MQRKWAIIFITLFIGIIVIVSVAIKVHSTNVEAKYSIPNNPKDIQRVLTYWENRGNDKTHHIKLINVVHLGKSDTYIAYFEDDSDILGTATLKEGPNKKLDIINSHSGGGTTRYGGVKTDQGDYGIVTGKNTDKKIHSIRVELLNDPLKFTVQVPEKDYFIIVKKLPKGKSSIKFADLYLFDKNNKELKP